MSIRVWCVYLRTCFKQKQQLYNAYRYISIHIQYIIYLIYCSFNTYIYILILYTNLVVPRFESESAWIRGQEPPTLLATPEEPPKVAFPLNLELPGAIEEAAVGGK